MRKLKSCPFCGEAEQVYELPEEYAVFCDGYGVVVTVRNGAPLDKALQDSIDAWNNRA